MRWYFTVIHATRTGLPPTKTLRNFESSSRRILPSTGQVGTSEQVRRAHRPPTYPGHCPAFDSVEGHAQPQLNPPHTLCPICKNETKKRDQDQSDGSRLGYSGLALVHDVVDADIVCTRAARVRGYRDAANGITSIREPQEIDSSDAAAGARLERINGLGATVIECDGVLGIVDLQASKISAKKLDRRGKSESERSSLVFDILSARGDAESVQRGVGWQIGSVIDAQARGPASRRMRSYRIRIEWAK